MGNPRSDLSVCRMTGVLLALASLGLASCSLEGTLDVPGELNRFDPVSSYPAVAAAAGPGAHLVKLEARFVREDGTQDLEASYIGHSAVNTYRFLRPSGKREDPSVPIGARAPVAPFELVEVTIQKPHYVSQSINGQEPQKKKHRGMALGVRSSADSKDSIAAPGCSFTKLWAVAKQHRAPAGSVAAITYDASGYELRIDGTDVLLRFDGSCGLRTEGNRPGEKPPG